MGHLRRRIASRVDTATLSALIGDIYDAAIDGRLWSGVMTKLAHAAGADRALLFTPSEHADRFFWASHDIEPALMAGYGEHYVHEDLWTRGVFSRGFGHVGAVMTSEMLVSEREFLRSPFLNEFLEPIEVFRYAGLFVDDGAAYGHPAMTVSLYGSRSREPFDATTLSMFRVLAPHLRRGLRTHWAVQPARAHDGMPLTAMAELAAPMIVCAVAGDVLYANASAEELLRRGELVTVSRGRLAMRDVIADRRLQGALADAIAPALGPVRGATLMATDSAGAVSTLIVCPLRPSVALGAPSTPARAALVTVYPDAASLEPAFQLLRASFGLTPSELRLLEHLATGESLRECADTFSIAYSTARTQLNSMLHKTHTRRYMELLKLVWRLQAVARRAS